MRPVAALLLLFVCGYPRACASVPRTGPCATSQATTGVQPAIAGAATPRLFEFIGKLGIQIVDDHVTQAKIGSFATTQNVPVLGHFDVHFDNLMLDSVDVSSTTAAVAAHSNGTLSLAINGLAAAASSPFRYRRQPWPHITGHGTATVRVHGGALQLQGRILNDGAGWPMLQLAGEAYLTFAHLDVHISNTKLAVLYNLVLAAVHGILAAAIRGEVLQQVVRVVQVEASKLLRGLPLMVDVLGLKLNVTMAVGVSHNTLTRAQSCMHFGTRSTCVLGRCPVGTGELATGRTHSGTHAWEPDIPHGCGLLRRCPLANSLTAQQGPGKLLEHDVAMWTNELPPCRHVDQ